jgi:hypothetical protein
LSPKPVEFGITHSPGIVTNPGCTNTQRVHLLKKKVLIDYTEYAFYACQITC